MRVAIVDIASGLVINVAEIDEGDGSMCPDGVRYVPSSTANIGDAWNGTEVFPKPEPLRERDI